MRISFDIDDTLVCGPSVPVEQVLSRWRRWRYREGLRHGTQALMRALVKRRCQIWVYTTSYRSASYLHGWFKSFGVALGGVVNQYKHDEVVGRHGPSKYPPAFGIDLHVDDSEGVRLEGEQHGFAVVVVSPEDPDWTSRVVDDVDKVLLSRLDSGSRPRTR